MEMDQLADSSTYDKDISVSGESPHSDIDRELSTPERSTPNGRTNHNHLSQAYRNINSLATAPFLNNPFAFANSPYPSVASFNPLGLLHSANGALPTSYPLDPIAMATAIQSASINAFSSGDSALPSSAAWTKYLDHLSGRKRRHVKTPSPTESASSSTSEILAVKKIKTMQNQPTSTSLNCADEKKDDGYWDRRRKNNEAAKRSRDAKRLKEVHTAQKAEFLERENVELKAQISLLKGESANLQFLLFNNKLNSHHAMNTPTSSTTTNLLKRGVIP